jgi:hypothetical protein
VNLESHLYRLLKFTSECASADHASGAAAITNSLRSKARGAAAGYYIQTSGTGILGDASLGFGRSLTKVYDDIADVQEITSFPLSRWHRNVDKIVLDAAKDDPENAPRIKTAIICPPFIYDTGAGPIGKRSVQLPELALASLSFAKSFSVIEGQNVWHHILVRDLQMPTYSLLRMHFADKMIWGPEAYYFVESGQHVSKFSWLFNFLAIAYFHPVVSEANFLFLTCQKFVDISKAIAEDAFKNGYLKTDEVVHSIQTLYNHLEAPYIWAFDILIWGTNSKDIASRIRSFSWKAQKRRLSERQWTTKADLWGCRTN